jgi:hypothetical protein
VLKAETHRLGFQDFVHGKAAVLGVARQAKIGDRHTHIKVRGVSLGQAHAMVMGEDVLRAGAGFAIALADFLDEVIHQRARRATAALFEQEGLGFGVLIEDQVLRSHLARKEQAGGEEEGT